MSKKLLAVAVAPAALAFAGTAAAGGKGATVVDDQGCTPVWFGTSCVVTKTTTNTTTTPSGNLSYTTNGTIETTVNWIFGASLTRSTEIHDHSLLKDGVFAETGTHYTETWDSVIGTTHLSCIEAWTTHWAGDHAQPGDFVLDCQYV